MKSGNLLSVVRLSNSGIPMSNVKSKRRRCSGCNKRIRSRYLLEALGQRWHEACLKCDECCKGLYVLGDKFYYKFGKKLCRHDYIKLHGSHGRCARCKQTINPTDYVMKCKENVLFHLLCFKCARCQTTFCVGDQVFASESGDILCFSCFNETPLRLSSSNN